MICTECGQPLAPGRIVGVFFCSTTCRDAHEFKKTVTLDLRGRPGDIRFECPVCRWGVTLKPEGAALWTQHGAITPQCREDRVPLTRTVIPQEP